MTAADVNKYLTGAQISPVDVAAQNPITDRSIDMGVPEPAPFTGLGQRALNHGINRVVAVYDPIERQADLPTELPRDRLQTSHRSTIAGHWSGGFLAGSKREPPSQRLKGDLPGGAGQLSLHPLQRRSRSQHSLRREAIKRLSYKGVY